MDISVSGTIYQKRVWKYLGGFSPLSPPWLRLRPYCSTTRTTSIHNKSSNKENVNEFKRY